MQNRLIPSYWSYVVTETSTKNGTSWFLRMVVLIYFIIVVVDSTQLENARSVITT